jgi:hypothetical protein
MMMILDEGGGCGGEAIAVLIMIPPLRGLPTQSRVMPPVEPVP